MMISRVLGRVELEGEPSLGDAESRPAAGVLEDGVAVKTGAAFQHHKPEAAAVFFSPQNSVTILTGGTKEKKSTQAGWLLAHLLSMFNRTLFGLDGLYALLKESSTCSSVEDTTLNSVPSNLYKYIIIQLVNFFRF